MPAAVITKTSSQTRCRVAGEDPPKQRLASQPASHAPVEQAASIASGIRVGEIFTPHGPFALL